MVNNLQTSIRSLEGELSRAQPIAPIRTAADLIAIQDAELMGRTACLAELVRAMAQVAELAKQFYHLVSTHKLVEDQADVAPSVYGLIADLEILSERLDAQREAYNVFSPEPPEPTGELELPPPPPSLQSAPSPSSASSPRRAFNDAQGRRIELTSDS